MVNYFAFRRKRCCADHCDLFFRFHDGGFTIHDTDTGFKFGDIYFWKCLDVGCCLDRFEVD